MLKRKTSRLAKMTPAERERFERAVAEEQAAKAANIQAARAQLPRLVSRYQEAVAIVRQLREAREEAGITLADLEQRTGIRKSVLSRLENSRAPNPTLATLQRYAEALGRRIVVSLAAKGRK